MSLLSLLLALGVWDGANAAPIELRLASMDASRAAARADAALRFGPLVFAEPHDVSVTPDTHGRWTDPGDGTRRWRLQIVVPGATDLNFGFDRFALPAGARLRISAAGPNAASTAPRIYGPADQRSHGQLWTSLFPGSIVDIELTVPAGARDDLALRLARVSAGFRDLLKTGALTAKGAGSCNIDVVCPQGDPWREEIRSVATYSLNGTRACTGTLMNDVPESGTPWFLTAHHCGVNSTNAPSMVTYWNFESPTCGLGSGGSLSDVVSGATWIAGRQDVDFTLVRLDQAPPSEFDASFAGWDRTPMPATGTVAIHHPRTEEKSISFNDDPVTPVANCIVFGATEPTHWEVDDWEQGTTEPGSSGSGLWDRDTHRLIGFLTGGSASCAFPQGEDCYGQFAVAWDGDSSSERLRDWLDPEDTDTTAQTGRSQDRLLRDGFEF